jgi:hypothetical protein
MQDGKRSCAEARDLAVMHLASVRAKIVELKQLENGIAGLVKSCEASCLGGPGPDCVLLEDLATSARTPASAPNHRPGNGACGPPRR